MNYFPTQPSAPAAFYVCATSSGKVVLTKVDQFERFQCRKTFENLTDT